MNFQKLLYPLSVNVAIVAFWTAVVGHNNTNYFWTNHAIALATVINVCQIIRNAFDMLEKELDEVIRDSENEKQKPRPRPITVSDLINCIRAIGKIDVKFMKTYNFAPLRNEWIEPINIPKEPLMDKSWCDLDDTNILSDKRTINNVNYYESDDEVEEDARFRNKRVIHVKVEDAMDAIEQEVENEVANEVENEVENELETEGSNEVNTESANELETEGSNEVLNEVNTECANKVDEEGSNEVETNVSNKCATNVSNEADTNDSEYVVVE